MTTPCSTSSGSARRRRAAGPVPPPPLSNTRGAVALEDAIRAATTAAEKSARRDLDYQQAFHEAMQASGFARGQACTCGWEHIDRHTLACGYTEQEGMNGTQHSKV